MIKALRIFAVIAVFSLVAFDLFYKLGEIDIAPWDEARHIVSAVEMKQSGNYLITSYDGQTDYYNLKPPLSIWGTMIGITTLGNDLFAARLSSVLFSFGTMLLIFGFALRYAGLKAALCAVIMCLSVPTLTLYHGLRSADPDALFIFCITASFFALSFSSARAIQICYVCLGLAFLAKSFNAMPFGMAAFIFIFYLAKRGYISLKTVVISPIFFVLPILPWGIARYVADGDMFIGKMISYDLLKRGTQAIEEHIRPPYFYIENIFYFFGIIFLIFLGLCLYNFVKKHRPSFWDRTTILLALWIFVPLIAYSIAKTRIIWYIYPVIPAIALIIACASIKMFGKKQQLAMMATIFIFFAINQYSFIASVNSVSAKPDLIVAHIKAIGRQHSHGDLYMDPRVGWQPRYLASVKLFTGLKPVHGSLEDLKKSTAPARFFLALDPGVPGS